MIRIEKSNEPVAWTAFRLTPDAKYEPKPELRESLLKEQGYICAYCMRRIPVKDKNSAETSKIEHLLSRAKHPDMQLDYSNMGVCCPGAIDNNFHCDKKKGDNDITFDLTSASFIDSLSYGSKDGKISCSNTVFDKEINGILNLNNKLLKANRLAVVRAIKKILDKRGWRKQELLNLLNSWSNKDTHGQYKEYCGTAIQYLNKKLKQPKL